MTDKTGRNDPCPCGSGKKYKSCCLIKNAPKPPKSLKDRKITARIASAEPEQKEKVISVDYNKLMERSFGESLSIYVDSPPIPENPEDYLPKN